eukprot:PLAT7739.1.p1 GENE.PLAT7739.1~~PLAT7739.1.p1  ORF type:complete len:310 (+),score=107.44 PLAT7739.1:32-931(+)
MPPRRRLRSPGLARLAVSPLRARMSQPRDAKRKPSPLVARRPIGRRRSKPAKTGRTPRTRRGSSAAERPDSAGSAASSDSSASSGSEVDGSPPTIAPASRRRSRPRRRQHSTPLRRRAPAGLALDAACLLRSPVRSPARLLDVSVTPLRQLDDCCLSPSSPPAGSMYLSDDESDSEEDGCLSPASMRASGSSPLSRITEDDLALLRVMRRAPSGLAALLRLLCVLLDDRAPSPKAVRLLLAQKDCLRRLRALRREDLTATQVEAVRGFVAQPSSCAPHVLRSLSPAAGALAAWAVSLSD